MTSMRATQRRRPPRWGVRVLPLLLLLALLQLLLAPSGVQCQDLQVQPPANTTVNLTVYTEAGQSSVVWTLSNPSTLSMTLTNLSLIPPVHPSLSLKNLTLPLPIVQGGSPAVTLLINVSSLFPSSFNASILLSYTINLQPHTLTLASALTCGQAFTTTTLPFPPTLTLTPGTSLTSTLKLRSQPLSPLNLSLTPNLLHSDIPGSTPSHTPYPGGGPLLTVSPAFLLFNSATWNLTQTLTLTAIPTSLIYGSRWSYSAFSYQTDDATLLPLLPPLLTAVNVTIVESNTAGVSFSNTSLTVTKMSAPLGLTLSLSCQPRAPVTVTLPSNAWLTLTPSTLTFTPLTWNTSTPLTLTLTPDYTLGTEHITLSFPPLSSIDADFASTSPPPLNITLLDPDPSFSSFYPPFGSDGTNLTLTWPSPLTFTPLDLTYPSATVACVFGYGQYACNTSASGWCEVETAAVVVGEREVECEVPACVYDEVQGRPCYSPAMVSARINGVDAFLSSAATANLTATCSPPPSRCLVGPSEVNPGLSPIPAQCLSAGCPYFPSTFSYLPAPVITSLSPTTVELSESVPLTVVLTVLGAGAFSSDTALCVVGGVASPAYGTFASNLTTATYPYSAVLTCLSPIRDDLLGSTSAVPLLFSLTLTGQATDQSTAVLFLSGVDSVARKASSDLTLFMVCCLLAFGSVVGLAFQHYCCRDCRAVNHRLTGEGKRRGERGPQMLIDLLEPRVRLKLRLVHEEERRRKEEEDEERQRIEEVLGKLKADKRAEEERQRREKEAVQRAVLEKERVKAEQERVGRAALGSPKPAPMARARFLLRMMRATGASGEEKEGKEGKKEEVEEEKEGEKKTMAEGKAEEKKGEAALSPSAAGRRRRHESVSRVGQQHSSPVPQQRQLHQPQRDGHGEVSRTHGPNPPKPPQGR